MLDACTAGRRNNAGMQAATPIPRVRVAPDAPARRGRASGARIPAPLARVLGALGLLGILASVLLVAAGAAGGPSQYVPAREGGWPAWLAGPLRGLGIGLSSSGFQALMLALCASYLLVLATARALPLAALLVAIVLAHIALLLGPPLISQDVFGYLAFARIGALHGLDPYTHVAAEAPRDVVYGFIGWPFQHSPYGPPFTLASYATAPLGLAGGLWAFKAIAVTSSLAAIALIMRAAARLGHSPGLAAAFVGLNPVLLVFAVGGAHNDTLLLLSLAAALALTAGASPRFRAGALALAARGRREGHRRVAAAVPGARTEARASARRRRRERRARTARRRRDRGARLRRARARLPQRRRRAAAAGRDAQRARGDGAPARAARHAAVVA